MSKNLTRKGIAFGALVALGTTLIAGVPASAAGITGTSKVSLLPTTGTEYTVLAVDTNTFRLTGTVANSLRGAATTGLKWLVTAEAAIVPTVANGGTPVIGTRSATTGITIVTADDYAADLVLTQNAADTTTRTAAVTAWYDDNNNSKIDADEYEVSQTVTFKKATELSVVTALTSPSVGDNKLDAVITTTPVLNGEQVLATSASAIDANFTRQGSATIVTASAVTGATTTWNDTKKQFTVSLPSYLTVKASPWASLSLPGEAALTAATGVDSDGATAGGTVTVTATAPAGHGLTTNDFITVDLAENTGDAKLVAVASVSTNVITYVTPAPAGAVDGSFATATTGTYVKASLITDADAVDSDTTGTAGTVTVTVTSNGHGLATGDYVSVNVTSAYSDTAVPVKVTVSDANTFTYTIDDNGANNGTSANQTGSFVKHTVKTISGQYSAKALVSGVAAGTEQGVGVVAATAVDTEAIVVGTASNTSADNVTAASATAVSVLKGTSTAIPVEVTLYKTDTTEVAAGVIVKATVSGVTGTVTVNGTKVANGDVVSATTIAGGTVVYSVASSTAATSDAVTLEFNAEGLTGAAASKLSFTWALPTLTLVDLNEADGSTSDYNSERTIVKGGTASFKLAMLNQFGSYIVGDYRAKVTTTGRTAGTTIVDFVAGVATVNIVDAALVGQTNIVVTAVDIEKKVDGTWTSSEDLSVTSGYLEEWQTNAAGGQKTINVIDAQTDKVQLSTATTTYASALVAAGNFSTTGLLAAGDNRLRGEDETATSAIRIGGNVVNANTLGARKSASVTVTGPANVVFNVGQVYGAGSLTFLANEDGGFEIRAISNIAQKDTVVTVTSGAASATTKITFNKAADDTGKTLTIAAPAVAVSGSTAVVTVSLKDKFGNAVVTEAAATGYVNGGTSTDSSIKVTYTGPGFVTATIPSVTDADGNIKFVVLLGANDKGTATVSAAYDSNGSNTDVVGTTLVASATATITVGAEVVAAAVTSSVAGIKGFVAVTVRNASGKAVTVTVNGRVLTPRAPNSAGTLYGFRAKAGKTTVVVKVDGVTVASRTVTVK